jgi:putative thioredoxin
MKASGHCRATPGQFATIAACTELPARHDMPAFSIDVTTEHFQHEVIEASFQQPVLVDFWAPWCGPCRTLKPMLEKLAGDYQGKFLLAKVNSDEHQELAARYQVRSIPAVKAFVDGELVDEFMGALPEAQVRAFIDRLLPSAAAPLRAEAAALWASGDREGALAKLVEGSRLDPADEGIRLDAVEVLVALGRADEARPLLELPYDEERDRAQSLKAQLDLAGKRADPQVLEALAAKIRANPKDHASRIALATALAADRQYEAAFEQLLESIYRDKGWNEGEARRTMLQLFDLLAPDPMNDDLIRQYRRQLATALN